MSPAKEESRILSEMAMKPSHVYPPSHLPLRGDVASPHLLAAPSFLNIRNAMSLPSPPPHFLLGGTSGGSGNP